MLELPSAEQVARILRATSDGYAMVDPNKLTLLTPGIDRKTGEYLTSACRRRWSPTTCASSASCRRSATSTASSSS